MEWPREASQDPEEMMRAWYGRGSHGKALEGMKLRYTLREKDTLQMATPWLRGDPAAEELRVSGNRGSANAHPRM